MNLIACFFWTCQLLLGSWWQVSHPQQVVQALEQGDAKILSTAIEERLWLVIDNKSGDYPRTQARVVLQDFFDRKEVQSFQVTVAKPLGDHYSVSGWLQTASGKFQTRYLLVRHGGQWWLQSLSFDSR